MTIFHKILKREIPADIIYEDDKILAFKDINPKARVHFLVIPKVFIDNLDSIDRENLDSIAHIFLTIPKIAKALGLERGYRVVNNCREYGGQEVNYIHFHVLGGEKLSNL